MKLIDLLVKELPKRGGWPIKVTSIGQDYDRELMFYGRGKPRTGIILDELAVDHRKRGDSDKGVTRAQYESALAKNDGWIEWGGGECPVHESVNVDITFEDGSKKRGVPAGAFIWQHDEEITTIIAYRLHKPGINSRANDDRLEQDLNECIGQDVADEWDGEGLPPVGCECEYVHGLLAAAKNDNKPKSNTIVRVVAHQYYNHRDVCVCVWINAEGGIRSSVFSPRCLKPVRSEAEKAREQAKNIIAELCRSSASNGHSADLIVEAIAAGKIPGIKLEVE